MQGLYECVNEPPEKIFLARRVQKIVWLLQNIQVFEEIVSWNLTEKEKVLRSRLKSFWQIKGLSTFLSPPHKCGFGKYLKTFLLNSNINISPPTLLWTRPIYFPRSNFSISAAYGYLKVYFKATIRFFAKEFRERKIRNYLWFIYQLNVGQMATRCQIHSKLSLLVGVFTLRLTDLLVLGVFRSKTRLHKKMSACVWALKSKTFWSNGTVLVVFFLQLHITFSDLRVSGEVNTQSG